jgi:hypothetical protein
MSDGYNICAVLAGIGCMLVTSPALSVGIDPGALLQEVIPQSAAIHSALDLRHSQPPIHYTDDTIFVVRDPCGKDGAMQIDEYAMANLQPRRLTLKDCGRFTSHGEIITAIGADASRIFIKFGLDPDDGVRNYDLPEGKAPNLVVLERTTHNEIAVGHTRYWIEHFDAAGSTIVGCACPYGGFVNSPDSPSCVSAERSNTQTPVFRDAKLAAAVACLGDGRPVEAARIYGANGSGAVAANDKYVAVTTNLGTAFFTVAPMPIEMKIHFPYEGYKYDSLGSGATSSLVTALKKDDKSLHLGLLDLSTNLLREIAVIRSERTIVPITHVYDHWVVGVFGDTVMAYPIDKPDRLYVYRTENAAWVSHADLYNTALVVRSVPLGKSTNDELPPIQINLNQLVREPGR